MAELLVIGTEHKSSWALMERLRVAGHQVELVTSRRLAVRLIARGRVDALAVDSPLEPGEELGLFNALQSAIPGLPKLITRAEIAEDKPIWQSRGHTPDTQALSRVVSYLFGLAAGRRIAVPSELEPTVPRPPRLRAIATDVRHGTVLFEYLTPPPGGPTTEQALRILTGRHAMQATARLRFPGRGTLRVTGVVKPVQRWEGAPPALLLTYQPRRSAEQASLEPSGTFVAVARGFKKAHVGLQRISARIRSLSGRMLARKAA